MATAQILTIGDELLSGDTVNSNLGLLGGALSASGDLGDPCAFGPGPDRTRSWRRWSRWAIGLISAWCRGARADLGRSHGEAVARACGVSLQRNLEAEATLVAMFARLGRPMPDINRKQADLPVGADMLVNAIGTAPGFAVRLPGSARERPTLLRGLHAGGTARDEAG